MRTAAVWTLLLLMAPDVVECATLRVARDGSGDFEVLADAVLAASSGDTITIAPGVYPEVRTFDTPGGPREYVAYVKLAELTIVGDDRDTVILGPPSPAADLENGPRGLVTSVDGNVRLRGVTVRNVAAGVWGNAEWMDVEDCRFTGSRRGVTVDISGAAVVRDCEFVANAHAGVMVFRVRGGNGTVVERCTFVDNQFGIDFQPGNCVVRDSRFLRGQIGVQVSLGGSALVERCEFESNDIVGLGVLTGLVNLYDSTFSGSMQANVYLAGRLVGTGNELQGGTVATIRIASNFSTVDFTGNHILNAGGYSVDAYLDTSPPLKYRNFAHNYWGTQDTAQIDAWIRDHTDDPTVNYVVVEYLPLADQPITVEATSIGALKARFGQ